MLSFVSSSIILCHPLTVALVRNIRAQTFAKVKLPETKARNEDQSKGLNPIKSKLILQLKFKDAKEAVPFTKLPISTLLKIIKTTKSDAFSGFTENRLYYIAQRIQYPLLELSELISKRTFIFTLSPEWLKQTLDVLLEKRVPGHRIANDLWVLKYHPETIRRRLEAVENAGIKNLHPWMVRCPEPTLQRFIQLANEPKVILGQMNMQAYLAKRLDTTPEQIQEAFDKVPALQNIRVTKMKRFIDFLLKEGFSKEEIAAKLRVVTASQSTVKQRIEILRKMGVENINLNLLVRSQTEFDRICSLLNSDPSLNKYLPIT